MKKCLVPGLAFLVCLAAGQLLGFRLFSGVRGDSAGSRPASETAAPPALARLRVSGGSGAGEVPGQVGSRVAAWIAWEQELARLPVAEFAEAFEKERRTAKDNVRVSRLLAVWAERDLEGAAAWAKRQPLSLPLPEAGYNIAVNLSVLEAASRKDPERAWQLAEELSGGEADVGRWRVVGELVRQNPEVAREFVRRHREALATMQSAPTAWFAVAPEKAMPVVMELPPGPNRLDAVKRMAHYYTEREQEAEAARRWFQTLPPAEQAAVAKSAKRGEAVYGASEEHEKRLIEAWTVPAPEEAPAETK